MTNEEAKANLEKLLLLYDDGMIDFSAIRESVQMAIEALQNSPSQMPGASDAVNRILAIETAIDAADEWDGGYNITREQIIRDALEKLPSAQPLVIHCTDCEGWLKRQSVLGFTVSELPSAQPEPKTGKWINNIHDIPICSQCGYMTPYDRAIDDYEYGNFCPNCGAKMQGGDTND